MDRAIQNTTFFLKRTAQAFCVYLTTLVASCSSVTLPEDLVEQYLDEDSLLTVSRMVDPITFYRGFDNRASMNQKAETEFAYLAPFEINKMGDYKLYLWAAYSIDQTVSQTIDPENKLIVQLDYDLLSFEPTAANWQDLGIEEATYKSRIGLDNEAIFELTQEQLSLFFDSEEIYLSVDNETNFSLWKEKSEVNAHLNAFLQLTGF